MKKQLNTLKFAFKLNKTKGKIWLYYSFSFLKKLHVWSSYENSAIHVYSLDRTKFCTEVYFDWVLNTITLQKRGVIISELCSNLLSMTKFWPDIPLMFMLFIHEYFTNMYLMKVQNILPYFSIPATDRPSIRQVLNECSTQWVEIPLFLWRYQF